MVLNLRAIIHWREKILLSAKTDNGVLPKYNAEQELIKFSEFRESDKSLKHELVSFKDPVSLPILAGTVVASWSLRQEVAGSNPFSVITNIFVNEFDENI